MSNLPRFLAPDAAWTNRVMADMRSKPDVLEASLEESDVLTERKGGGS
jgi:hypothetical protein